MPARLIPNDAVPTLAEQIDSPAMLRVLRHLQEVGFIYNDGEVSRGTAAILKQLTDLGLIDPGYEETCVDKPYLWTSNGNGSRVLRFIEASASLRAKLETTLEIHPRARTGLSALSEWDRAKVLAAAEALHGRDPATWPVEEAALFNTDKQFYLLRATPELRAFIRVLDSGEIEIFDIVRKETLQFFLERQQAVGAGQ